MLNNIISDLSTTYFQDYNEIVLILLLNESEIDLSYLETFVFWSYTYEWNRTNSLQCIDSWKYNVIVSI